jgi:S-adenosylmethionine decarboxylase
MIEKVSRQKLGSHFLVELLGCDPESISLESKVEETLLKAVAGCGAYISHSSHQFSPTGVSTIVLIAESHFTIHTWPEHAYCALDIFTCGEQMNPRKAIDILQESFKAQKVDIREMDRGFFQEKT